MACYILSIPIELIDLIINNHRLLLVHKINFIVTCTTFEKNINIKCLYGKINNDVLLQPKFSTIGKLHIKYPSIVTKIPCFSHLLKLKLSCNKTISVSELLPLDVLDIGDRVENNTDELINLNYSVLNVTNSISNSKRNILDIKSFTNLTSLTIVSHFGNMEITNLKNLVKLDISHTYYYHDNISNLTNLTYLNISYTHTSQHSINNLTNLTCLNIKRTKFIYSLTHLINLQKLDMSEIYCEPIAINNLTNITDLNIAPNRFITKYNISHLINLTKLNGKPL